MQVPNPFGLLRKMLQRAMILAISKDETPYDQSFKESQHILDAVAKLDPSTVKGIIVLAVTEAEDGLDVMVQASATPAVSTTLVDFLKLTQMEALMNEKCDCGQCETIEDLLTKVFPGATVIKL